LKDKWKINFEFREKLYCGKEKSGDRKQN